MSDYSVLGRKLREQLHEFSCKLSPHFSVPKQRFVEQMLYGLSAMQDVKLSSCLLYTSPSPRDLSTARMPSSA